MGGILPSRLCLPCLGQYKPHEDAPASQMANGIAPIQHVSSQLGHRRTSMTHDVYVHPMAPDRSYISALEQARQAAHGTNPGTYPQRDVQPTENVMLASAGGV
jgi:hypothetical protein